MSNMPKWLLVLIIGSVSICLCCGGVGVYAGVKIRKSGPDAVAKHVEIIVSDSLADNPVTNGQLVIDEGDLVINNIVASAGEAKIMSGNGGVTISGLYTSISPEGISFASEDGASMRYAAMPVVQNGQVEMQIESGGNWLLKFFNFQQGIFDGIERAINNQLAAQGLQAESVTLHDGSLTIETVPL